MMIQKTGIIVFFKPFLIFKKEIVFNFKMGRISKIFSFDASAKFEL